MDGARTQQQICYVCRFHIQGGIKREVFFKTKYSFKARSIVSNDLLAMCACRPVFSPLASCVIPCLAMRVVEILLISCAPALHAALLQPWQRRRVVGAGVGALGAEAAGLFALPSPAAAAGDGGVAEVVDGAAVDGASGGGLLPPGTIEQIESGRVVVLRDWLPKDLLASLRTDAEQAAPSPSPYP